MLVVGKKQRQKIVVFLVPRLPGILIENGLQGLKPLILLWVGNLFSAQIHVNPVVGGVWQIGFKERQQRAFPDMPGGRQTGSAAEYFREPTECIQREQPSHAGTEQVGVQTARQGGVVGIDPGLQLCHDEPEIGLPRELVGLAGVVLMELIFYRFLL